MSKEIIAISSVLIVIIFQHSLAEETSEVFKSFLRYNIVPDVILTPPRSFLKVTYGVAKDVYLGNELKPTEVMSEPFVKWRTAVGSYYTLIMIDLDAPSALEPTMRAVNHWMVGNIPGNNVKKGETRSAYVGSGPGISSGYHRYVFLLYRQPGEVLFKEPYIPNNTIEGRSNFNTTNFALKYGLGEPIAGNFFLAKWDKYVPFLHKQLEIKENL